MLIPSSPVSNFYDIFSEAEITSVKANLVVEERLQKVSVETNDIIEENKFGNYILEEAIKKTKEIF